MSSNASDAWEKSFCALAVVVLALGICGVTTMFSASTASCSA